jgi:hypothetical protein
MGAHRRHSTVYCLCPFFVPEYTCISLQTLVDYVNSSRFLGGGVFKVWVAGFFFSEVELGCYKVLDVECRRSRTSFSIGDAQR